MKIAQIAPLFESVPPKLYGGTERVVSYLTEELVRQGHDVTLFASGDSVTSAKLVAGCAQSLRLDASCLDQLAHHIKLIELVARNCQRFDILHFHIDYMHFPFSARLQIPHLTTLHGRLDLPDLGPLYREFRHIPLVSISDAQRAPLPWVNWVATVYHGLPLDLYSFHERPAEYLAFIGRVSPEKRVDRAIEIAKRVGLKLKIAAKIDANDKEYYEEAIRPLLDDANVEFVGEIGEKEKDDFLGNARAMLFPIDWPEPFGLVMIEAMACGTPVIAFPGGSVPEVIDEGVTGFVVHNIEDAVDATANVERISRRGCRQRFEQRFSASRMARDYVRIYEQMVDRRPTAQTAAEVR